jgi:hypothetical protein
MPEIGSSGLMSGDGKRGVGHRPQATAPILDSTGADYYEKCLGLAKRAVFAALVADGSGPRSFLALASVK